MSSINGWDQKKCNAIIQETIQNGCSDMTNPHNRVPSDQGGMTNGKSKERRRIPYYPTAHSRRLVNVAERRVARAERYTFSLTSVTKE